MNMFRSTTVPKWIMVYTFIVSVICLVMSYLYLSPEGWQFAMRNLSVALIGLVAVFYGRNSLYAFFGVIIARLTVELGDIIGYIAGQTDMETLVIALIMLVIELVA